LALTGTFRKPSKLWTFLYPVMCGMCFYLVWFVWNKILKYAPSFLNALYILCDKTDTVTEPYLKHIPYPLHLLLSDNLFFIFQVVSALQVLWP
jgi:hypothetical protein